MQFNKHSNLEGQHAFLSASKYHWINYDISRLEQAFWNAQAQQRGTRIHAFAREAIELGVKLPKTKKTLNMYVNDALGFRMTPEQVLYYSPNCFGTADAISYRDNEKLLRIHDLKTGETPANILQLEVYEALFCLEYGKKPNDIRSELRIYQNDEIFALEPDPDEIFGIMETIERFDKELNRLKAEGERYV